MDITNRTKDSNLTAPVSETERNKCTHIVVYVEPDRWFFIARKENVITDKGNIFAALDKNRNLRTPKSGSKSFARFKDKWEQLLPEAPNNSLQGTVGDASRLAGP